jgi:hypothetical protein
LYVVEFCFMYNIHDVHLPISILFFQVNNIIKTFHEYRNKVWSLILSVAKFVLYFFIGLLNYEVLKMHTFIIYLFYLFKSKLGIRNCIKRVFFSWFFFYYLFLGGH